MENFFSSIQPNLKRYLIRRSLLFALPGFFLVLYMGIFLSASSLERWGLWGFAVGFSLISCGMIPYRKIVRLEVKPHKLSLDEKGIRFTHSKRGEVLFPFEDIKKLSFVQKKRFYGIRLYFKSDRTFLLPYFSKKTFNTLRAFL